VEVVALVQRKSPSRSTGELVGSIASDVATLVRKEVELARLEMTEAITARIQAAIALGIGAVVVVLTLVFLGMSAATALDQVMAPWASRLVVAGGCVVIAGSLAMIAIARMKRPSLVPEETARTLKEDIGWAKQQLKR
jgi:uncharacterized membrane protein YqjE